MPSGTVYADYVNPHNYVLGNTGCGAPGVLNQAWLAEDPVLGSCWDGIASEYVQTWAGHFFGLSLAQAYAVPRVSSETGWDSSVSGTTLDYQGKVLINTYLDAYKRGWSYTFIYEMVDTQGSTGNQGFYDSTNTVKLSGTYVHNLTTILADTTNFTPSQLSYWIPGEPYPVHDMLLQKSNGKFELIIWGEETTSATTDNVTVMFGAPHTVTEYDVTVGTSSVATFTNVTTIPMVLSDYAIILEFL